MRFRRPQLERYERQTVAVHTRDGQSIKGVLGGVYADCVVVRHAVHLDEGVKLEGDVVIPRANVSYLQAILPTEPISS